MLYKLKRLKQLAAAEWTLLRRALGTTLRSWSGPISKRLKGGLRSFYFDINVLLRTLLKMIIVSKIALLKITKFLLILKKSLFIQPWGLLHSDYRALFIQLWKEVWKCIFNILDWWTLYMSLYRLKLFKDMKRIKASLGRLGSIIMTIITGDLVKLGKSIISIIYVSLEQLLRELNKLRRMK